MPRSRSTNVPILTRKLSKSAMEFLSRPEHTQARFSRGSYFCLKDGTRLQGVTTLIEKLFVPTHVEVRGSNSCVRLDQVESVKMARQACRAKGTTHGSCIDYELQEYVRDPDKFNSNKHRKDQCTLAILRDLKKKRWRILSSQLIIYCATLRIGTAIDLLCVDEFGELVLLEVKCTQYLDYYHHVQWDARKKRLATFARPLQDVNYSVYNSHQLQLFLMKLIMSYQYGVRDMRVFLCQVNPAYPPIFHPLEKWVEKHSRPIFNYLLAHANVNKASFK